MKNIIQKDDKYYQIVYPVLLPTSITRPNNHVDGEENMYILSDEEIKKGDWAYDTLRKRIIKCTEIIKADIFENDYLVFEGNTGNPRDTYKKIIATTDKSLKIGTISRWKDDGKSHGRVEEDILLPSIPNNFLQAYVKAKGKMEKVLVEMNNVCLGNCASTYPLSIQCTKPNNCQFPLKLSSDNTITIIPFEEKKQNFTREEFKQALELLYFQKGGGYEDEFNEWFDKNY